MSVKSRMLSSCCRPVMMLVVNLANNAKSRQDPDYLEYMAKVQADRYIKIVTSKPYQPIFS